MGNKVKKSRQRRGWRKTNAKRLHEVMKARKVQAENVEDKNNTPVASWAKRRAQNSNAETPTTCTDSQENYVDSGLKDNQSDAPLIEISYIPPMEMSNNHLREYFAGYLTEAETPAETNRNLEEEYSAESENEIKVFCPKCGTEVSHTAEGIQEDRTKILIAKVYHYFEQEYEELKTIYGDLHLTPLSKFLQRTALATGVSETTILEVLKEEEGRNADKREEPPEKRRRARKKPIQTESSSLEDNPDDNTGDGQESNSFDEAQTLVVKIEPEHYNDEPEIYVPAAVKEEPIDIEVNIEQPQTDPIAINERIEPRSDVLDNTNETLALTEPAATKCKGIKIPTWHVTSTSTNETVALTEQAATKRKGRKTPRSDVTSTRQHTQAESSTAAAWSSVGVTEELDKDTVMKTEEIGIHEEGPEVGGPWKATLL